ncbi:hypothetical protein [Microbacterium sp.]|uniref:hypothetical protein n=1 Tax=Microbacterium sp. TaxID=51671 RepID=UPI002732D0F0|nr:hypothetical protein [Microbacterium sp.]MDP3950524.1 hypothetical protein [Microbacterium sp.]
MTSEPKAWLARAGRMGAVKHIFDSFPVARRHEERDHGEFQMRRLVLDYFGRMATAADTRIPYETPIDPPHGHGPRHAPCTSGNP